MADKTGQKKHKVLLIVAQQGFQDIEYQTPKSIIEQNGYLVRTASISTKDAVGKLGTVIKPDLAVKDVKLHDYDMLVVIGGPGAPSLSEYPEVIKLIKEAEKTDMFRGAICIAPTILAKAGVLNNKKATVWHSVSDSSPIKILQDNGAIFVDEDVVQDSLLVTANGPQAADGFGKATVKMLNS